jgi:hypothetical protein
VFVASLFMLFTPLMTLILQAVEVIQAEQSEALMVPHHAARSGDPEARGPRTRDARNPERPPRHRASAQEDRRHHAGGTGSGRQRADDDPGELCAEEHPGHHECVEPSGAEAAVGSGSC